MTLPPPPPGHARNETSEETGEVWPMATAWPIVWDAGQRIRQSLNEQDALCPTLQTEQDSWTVIGGQAPDAMPCQCPGAWWLFPLEQRVSTQRLGCSSGGAPLFSQVWPVCHCRSLPDKIGDALTPAQYREAEELGILADKDDQAGRCPLSPMFWTSICWTSQEYFRIREQEHTEQTFLGAKVFF
jgi:hypothetical protein